ncbi:uncharacterized protein LOC112557855 [Pomacea canaliculata]|uniref:uncharacterized protein LOC112557855 n=1 Tax=Pomacea canaliculata TaxID=400727 RepID=UPI000D727AE1|nr:uncharacterized protein LOC112557855 [Pomacea canaliculata]XP_025083724.1 uncharacterized protein LOC112557855 [Pomacea canaliculata]
MATCWPDDSYATGVKAGDVTPDSDVYTITDDSLPSHMRSLLPSHERHVQDLLLLERRRRRVRCGLSWLATLLLLTVVVVVAVLLGLHALPAHQGSAPLSREYATTALEVLLAGPHRSALTTALTTAYSAKDGAKGRTPCVTECWAFAAFRFQATCQNGFCQCHSTQYDSDTCLPHHGGCNISALGPEEGEAMLQGVKQTTYQCRQESLGDRPVHVISIFGNHWAPATHVTVRENSSAAYTLVLVSYHSVNWALNLPINSSLDKGYVVSTTHTSQSTVSFSDVDKHMTMQPLLSVTGYGQDKYGGHTPELLHFLQLRVGAVTSFLGVPHADRIDVTV